ncbi:MAG TPA: HD domain-containing protein [Longimicrobiales bacterium]
MSAAVSIEAAAAGELPAWAVASTERREHIRRVVALLDAWACRTGLDERERRRWRAAGWLHDALRDAAPEALREFVPAWARDLPGPLLHGPAAAARLEADGVRDRALLDAVAYHTLGHPKLDRLGRALYLADFLEPGRAFEPAWRAALRARMPEAFDAVLREVVAARIAHLLRAGHPIRPESLAFWNDVAGEA